MDITTAVMTLSSFHTAPQEQHLEQAKCVVGYLACMKHGLLRFQTTLPDYSDLPDITESWEQSIYGNVRETIPHDTPTLLGRDAILMHYVDANLLHNLLTGRSITGIIHFLNGTPIDWYSKKQNTAKTATYGLEYIAVRTYIEQIINLCITLYYLGVPVLGPSRFRSIATLIGKGVVLL